MTIRKVSLVPVLLAACGVLAAVGVLLFTRFGAEDARVSAAQQPQPTPHVSDGTVPGPAAGLSLPAGEVNRAGSAEVAVRVYEPADRKPWATLVWAHGGSFVRGTLDWPESDWVAREFAAVGLRVYAVDYVLASDTVKAPAPARDVAAVLAAVAEAHAGPVLLGGASAGAHLAAEAALDRSDLTEAGRLQGMLLVYPTAHRVQQDRPDIAARTATLDPSRQFDAVRIAAMYDFYLGAAHPEAIVVGEIPAGRLATLPPHGARARGC